MKFLARMVFGTVLICIWFGVARGAEAARWNEHIVPVFRLVASQAGEDAGVPYTGGPGALAQDANGSLWIGTDVGLERWDGYRIRTYASRAGDPCALQVDYVVALYVDGSKRLWISTFDGGLAYYEPETDCVRTVGGGANELTHASVTSIAGDGTGGLWLGTTGGLMHLAGDLAQLTRLPEDASEQGTLSHERIGSVLRDRHGVIWVGSGRGLERRPPTEVRFQRVVLPAGVKVRTLLEGSDGRIWVGTVSNGAYVIDPSTMKIAAIEDILERKPIPLIWSAVETPSGEIWLGTTGAGIIRVDPRSLHSRTLHHQKGVATSLPDDEVIDFVCDRGGLVWVATDTGFGFFNSRDDVSTILSDDESNRLGEGLVKSIARMADDRLAIAVGTDIALIGPGVAPAEPVPFDPLPRPGSIAALATLNGRDLFAAVQPYGLVWFDRAARRSYAVPLPGPDTSRHILALLPDGDRLWVAGIEGLWLVQPGDGKTSTMPWLASRRFDLRDVLDIAMGPGGFLLIGTVKGLFRLNLTSGGPLHVQLESLAGDPVADSHIKTLRTDRQGRVWMGTNSEGLFVVEPSMRPDGRARVLEHLAEALPSGAVSKVLEDGRGTIWVSTDRGIASIDTRSFSVSRLTRGDGIAISSYVSGSCADASCDEMMFGGLNGITLIRPDRQVLAREPPALVITRVSVGRDEVPSSNLNAGTGTPMVRIPANANSLAVEFAALDFADPMHNRYQYQLEGSDLGWIPTKFDSRTAEYTNLPPGTYRLRLRGTDHAGTWSPRERQLLVRVDAAWHQTIWFHALEALGVVLAAFLIVQTRTVVLRGRQRELESMVNDRTLALIRAGEERSSLIENLAHDLRTPLTSLRGYLETLRLKGAAVSNDDRSRFIGIAVRQAERLNRLVRELFDLVRLDDERAPMDLERLSPSELVLELTL